MGACIAHQLGRGVKAHGLAVEQRGEKGIGVVALEPGTDIDQQREAGGMAFGEAVFAEAFDLLEDALGIGRVVALGHHAADQAFMEGAEAALALPGGHGTAQAVSLAGGEIGRQDGQLHHLLLKDRHAQGAAQGLAHGVIGVVNRLFTAAAAQVGVHHAALDGAGPHDGDLDHQVVELTRLQARQHAHLGPAFDLEGADAVGAAQHVVDRRIALRQLVHLQLRHAQLAGHHLQGAADGAQHAQGQDVNLDQAQGVQVVLVPLDDGAVVHGGVFHRHQAGDVVARDDEAARVLAQVARKADQLACERQPLAAHQGIGVEALLGQALGRDAVAVPPLLALGDGIDAVDVDAQRPPHVAQRRARPVADHHAGECGAVAAVLAVDVLDDFFAPLVFKIDVDVGRLVALSADEAAEQQVDLVVRGVDLGHLQAEAHHRVGRAAAALAQDALAARPVHDVGHGEEIGFEAELGDQRQFAFQRSAHRRRQPLRKAPHGAGFGQHAQPAGGAVAGGHDLFGVLIAQLGQREAAALGDGHRCSQPIGRVEPGQALARAQVRFGIGRQRQAGIGHGAAQAGCGERVLQGLAGAGVHQHVTTGHQRQAGERGHPWQHRQALSVMRVAEQFHRDGAAVGTEPGLEPHGLGMQRFQWLARLRQQDGKTIGQAGQKWRVGHAAFQIGGKGQVLPLGRTPAGHADPLRQVAVAAAGLRQQHQVRRAVAGQHGAVTRRVRRQIHLRTDDQVQLGFERGLMRMHHP